ncbi:hypothetical protein Tco_1235868 [Tanacetum coccineum]
MGEGLQLDVYTLVNHHTVAKEILDRVKLLIEGTRLSLQERESKLYNEFDRFTSKKGETIYVYYLSKFVTDVKLAKGMYESSFDQLYAYLRKHEVHANEVCMMRDIFPDPPALGRHAQSYVGSRAKGIANGTWANRNIGNSTANQTKLPFLARPGTELMLEPDTQTLPTTAIFQTDDLDAFDSDCDKALMTSNNVTFIASFIPWITSITVNGKNAYELKGKFLDDLHNNAFSGTNEEDAVEHIEYFLRIVDPIDLPNVNQDKLRVVFPISLAGDAWRCWREDGYCNGGNLPGAYIVGNSLHYQDFEWYEALKDSKLKDEALRNKAIMEILINEDDESSNDYWRSWENIENTNGDRCEREYENDQEDEERCELFDDATKKLSVCTVRRFEMIKYSFRQDEEYVAVKEDEYKDLTNTSKDACRAYQEIFRMIDE